MLILALLTPDYHLQQISPKEAETRKLRDSGLAYVVREHETEFEGNYEYRLYLNRRPTNLIEVCTHTPDVKAWKLKSGKIVGSIEHDESGSISYLDSFSFVPISQQST